MTKCDDIDRQLTAYLEGFLAQKDRKIVEEHLSLCAHCAEALEDLRRTRAILKAMDEVDPPPWLTERIMSQIREKEERKEGFFRRLFFPLHIKLPVQALATVFVAVLCVYVYRSTVPETGNFERHHSPLPGQKTARLTTPASHPPAVRPDNPRKRLRRKRKRHLRRNSLCRQHHRSLFRPIRPHRHPLPQRIRPPCRLRRRPPGLPSLRPGSMILRPLPGHRRHLWKKRSGSK